ncbi:MAG: hypothetical protein IKP20_08300 [Candidatus Methanomethylophilaceae archaeon]|nr:hypothetical protein [Candidatus Methanomethylophilaceae archaeon]
MFVSVEGLDGSGKTTASKIVADMIRSQGKDLLLIEHPGDGFLGRSCKRFLTKEGIPASLAAAAFLSAEMFLSSFRIRKSENSLVVRYTLSAYYLPDPVAKPIFRMFSAVMPVPDAIVFIDLDPEIAVGRSESRGKEREMFENIGSMREIREKILSVPGLIVVDGSGTPEKTAELIVEAIGKAPGNIF